MNIPSVKFSGKSDACLVEAWWDLDQYDRPRNLVLKAADGECLIVPPKSVNGLLKLIRRRRNG